MGKHFDIAICGGGMAGLSIAYLALQHGVWADKSILIVDKEEKLSNDKTWCFWDNGTSVFDDIVHRKWSDMLFFTNSGEKIKLDNGSFEYKMIRSVDFYRLTLDYLKQQSNVHFLYSEIESYSQTNDKVEIVTKSDTITAEYAFNSLLKKPALKSSDTYLRQHFKGKFIESDELKLNPNQIHLMDFRPSQEHGCTFVYLLPTSETSALVEYTLFSEKLLDKDEYDMKLDDYIHNVLGIENYKTIDEEFGVIPMTDYKFSRAEGRIINIGTAGGDTRGSTGYTFYNTQQTITKILDNYKASGIPTPIDEHIGKKDRLYDSTMLKVLAKGDYKGHQLFSDMFSKVPAHIIFNFLNSQSSLLQDFRVIRSLTPHHFIAPFVKSLLGN